MPKPGKEKQIRSTPQDWSAESLDEQLSESKAAPSGKKKSKLAYWVALAMCLCCFATGAYMLVDYLVESKRGIDSYADLMAQVAIATPQPTPTPDTSATSAPETTLAPHESINPQLAATPTPLPAPVDVRALYEANNDFVAWLEIPGLDVAYPVTQGTDNSYYLTHTFAREENPCGCIFLQSNNSDRFGDEHSVVYGHNMKNGTMFHNLRDLRDQETFEEHRTINLYLLDGTSRTYEIVAVSPRTADPELMTLLWQTNEDKQAFIDTMMATSEVVTDTVPTVEDAFLSLITCIYDFDNARLVVFAIRK